QPIDPRVLGRSLGARVPAEVVVAAVAVALAVHLVVLRVVAHEVVEREAVVTSDEVDAVRRSAPVASVKIAAARDARCHLTEHAGLAAQEAPQRIAILPVPLHPAVAGEVSDLVKTGRVPGFRD